MRVSLVRHLREQTPVYVSWCREWGVWSLAIHLWRWRLECYAGGRGNR